jgi:hypothetical protein
MGMTRSWRALLLFTLAGCIHNLPPDAADLAPLAAYITHESYDQSNQPLVLSFYDEFTSTVFRSLRRDARYKFDTAVTRLVCPSKAAEVPQGYLLRARVNKVMGDSAIATTERMCGAAGGSITFGENYLLVRRRGIWRIQTIISGFTTVAN